MRKLLIDGDILVYTVAARVETKVDWGDTGRSRTVSFSHARSELLRWLGEIMDTLNSGEAIIALSDPSKHYFRHDVYPLYKAHRTGGEKPLILGELSKFLLDNQSLNTYLRPGLEADDILGILGTHPTQVEGEKVIVTADKDLLQIPGLHFNPRKPKEGVYEQTAAAADRFFYRQCLSGDPTDGVPGCPRIGPVKAEKILDEAYMRAGIGAEDLETHVWQAVVGAYSLKEKDEAYALSQARCVRILRHTDYDYAHKKPILWNPCVTKSS